MTLNANAPFSALSTINTLEKGNLQGKQKVVSLKRELGKEREEKEKLLAILETEQIKNKELNEKVKKLQQTLNSDR